MLPPKDPTTREGAVPVPDAGEAEPAEEAPESQRELDEQSADRELEQPLPPL